MTDSRRASRHVIVTIAGALALAISASLFATAPATASTVDPPGIDAFMRALGQVESGGSYTARNSSSGAYGKYQIMPSSWRAWALQYLGNASAPQTPANQEFVARSKIRDLYWWLDAWPYVAHWWLTGSGSKDTSSWSSYSRAYVDKVMTLYKQYSGASATSAPLASWITWQEMNPKLLFAGGWSRAYSYRYWEGYVRYSRIPGARVSFRFTGTAFQWIGPRGPGRGRAHVYVNGVLAGIVDLAASYWQPRQLVFQRTYAAVITREVLIVVDGTPGRPTVAIDAIRLRR